MDLDKIKCWVKDPANIPIYLFSKESDKHLLEVVDSGSGEIIYKSTHATRLDAADHMCEVKGIEPPERDGIKVAGRFRRSEKARNKMKDRRKQVLKLYVQGVSYKEIAQMLEVSVQTINNDLRALKVRAGQGGDLGRYNSVH